MSGSAPIIFCELIVRGRQSTGGLRAPHLVARACRARTILRQMGEGTPPHRQTPRPETPTASAKLECFQRLVFRIDEPHVAHSRIGVDFALAVFVGVACGWRQNLAHPIRDYRELTLRPTRHGLESPSGEIRHQNIFLGEMDFRLMRNPPASGIFLVMTERMLYDLEKRSVSHDMRSERPRQDMQPAVDDLRHMACGCLQYVLIPRFLARLRWRCPFSWKSHHLLQLPFIEGYYTVASASHSKNRLCKQLQPTQIAAPRRPCSSVEYCQHLPWRV